MKKYIALLTLLITTSLFLHAADARSSTPVYPIGAIAQSAALQTEDPENTFDVEEPQEQGRRRTKFTPREWNDWCDEAFPQPPGYTPCPKGITRCQCSWFFPLITCPIAWQAGIESHKATMEYMQAHGYNQDYSILPNYAALSGFTVTGIGASLTGVTLACCIDYVANRFADAINPIFKEEKEE
jgi:hypothetical protein